MRLMSRAAGPAWTFSSLKQHLGKKHRTKRRSRFPPLTSSRAMQRAILAESHHPDDLQVLATTLFSKVEVIDSADMDDTRTAAEV